MLHVLWLLSTPICTHNMNIYICMIWIIYWLIFNNAQAWNEDIIGESPEIVVIISDDSSWCDSTSPQRLKIQCFVGAHLQGTRSQTPKCRYHLRHRCWTYRGKKQTTPCIDRYDQYIAGNYRVGLHFFGNMWGTSCWWRSQRNRQVRIMPNVGWTRKKHRVEQKKRYG